MNIKKIINGIFSIDTKTSNRIIISVLGVKIKILKKNIKTCANKYYNIDCPITEIPKATGILRKYQLADIKILKIFDKMCRDNNLGYWLDYGNLIGAVRHKGFIPWDDDIDVTMIRDDYEKFIKLFEKEIPYDKNLYLEFENNGINRCLLKLKHKKLSSLDIDIFTDDYYYKNVQGEEKKKLHKLLHKVCNRPYYVLLFHFYKYNNDKLRKRFIKTRDKEILKGNKVDIANKPSIYCGIDYYHVNPDIIFDYDTIFPLREIIFEDEKFLSVNNPDKYLTSLYGNYMEMPKDCYPRHANCEDPELEKELDLFLAE